MSRVVARWPIRRPRTVVALWAALVAASFTIGIGVFDRLVSDVGRVPGSPSDRAITMIAEAGPAPVELTAIVRGRAGSSAPAAAVDTAVTDLRGTGGVAAVADPLPSATGDALLIRVQLTPGDSAEQTARAVAHRLRDIEAATVTVAGGPLTVNEFNAQAQADVQRAELVTTPVVLLLLLVLFGGLVAAGLPLLIALVGVGGTLAVLYGFSLAGDVSVYAVQVVTMLSVGLAVDYGLLIVSRFREERAADNNAVIGVRGAVERTMASAGRTVLFSGLTIAAVLAGLLVFPEPFLRSMGLAGVGVVAVVVAAVLTLLPALLMLFGRRIKPAHPGASGGGVFARIAQGVQRRPVTTLLATAAVMLVLTLPVLDLRLAQVDARLLPQATQTRALHDAIASDFPSLDRPGPIVIAVAAAAGSDAVTDLHRRVASTPHVTGVEITRSGPITVLQAALDTPAYGAEARTAVEEIRALDAPVEVAVTGDTALLIDYQDTITHHLPYAVALIAAGTLLLLFGFTGSILLPVKAVLTNLLSIGAALGAVVWVFQQGHLASWFGTTRLDAIHVSVPVLVATIAFGLSIDYEVFLLSRIREQWLATGDNVLAVARGLQHTGRIITSAALLLGVVFAGFLLAGFVPVQAIGLGLLLAIALDATIVRLLMVPATMTLAGRYNWWAPGPLRRLHASLGLQEPPPPRRTELTDSSSAGRGSARSDVLPGTSRP